jgi:hypothetical protein
VVGITVNGGNIGKDGSLRLDFEEAPQRPQDHHNDQTPQRSGNPNPSDRRPRPYHAPTVHRRHGVAFSITAPGDFPDAAHRSVPMQ